MTALHRASATARELLLMAMPHGGQLTARRNAWASMSEGSARARGRREADVALTTAQVRSDLRVDQAAAIAH